MAGIPVRDIMATLISELEGAKPDLDEVCNFKRRIGSQMVVEIGIPKIDIVVDIAKKYHGKIPLAVASSGYKDHVINSLKVNGIYDLFDAIVTAEDIANPKPAPDIFLMACHRIGCDPTKCRGFEDADAGMQSLRAAEMEAIDVRLMEGYPHASPSDISVLAPSERVNTTAAAGSAGGLPAAEKTSSAGAQKQRNNQGYSLRDFAIQALFVLAVAYFGSRFLTHIMFEAVKEDAWSAD